MWMMENRIESINSIIWSCCPKKWFCSTHRFMISTYMTMNQFNDNLWTQFNEGNWYEEIGTIKTFEFENTKRNIKNVVITEKKEKRYIRQITYTNRGHLRTKVTPDIDFADESVVESDVPDVKIVFADECKHIIKMINNIYK